MILAVLAALAVIALRLILHATGHAPQGAEFMLAHFLAVVTVVFFTDSRLLANSRTTTFPDFMREGFKGVAVYALLITGFLWYYYTSIEDTYFFDRVQQMVAEAKAAGQDETIIRPRIVKFFTAFNYASIAFFALLAFGGLLALLIGALHHKVLRRLRR